MLDHNRDINVIVKLNLYLNMLFVVLLRIYQIGFNNILSILKYTYVPIRIPRFQECFFYYSGRSYVVILPLVVVWEKYLHNMVMGHFLSLKLSSIIMYHV